MNWTTIRKILRDTPKEVLIDLLKGLYNLSPQNKAFIRTSIMPDWQDAELLEKSRKQITRAMYPDHVMYPARPRFGESRKVIRAYKKATGDISGTLDLMLLHVELGIAFTREYGDMDEQYYDALDTMLESIIDLMIKSPQGRQFYELYLHRLESLERDSANIGWGYADTVSEMLWELRNKIGVD